MPWQFALENLNIISTSSWYSVHASVHELLEEFHIFYVKVHRKLRGSHWKSGHYSGHYSYELYGGVYGGQAV